MSFIITILAALLVFSAVIAIHEFGHFIVAKLCGIQVNEFSIGMGPVLWKKNHKGTQYSLRALPVGGFVALEGEESPESQQAEAVHTVQEQPAPETEASVQPTGIPLNEAPVWQRALVMVAGAVMNFVLGFVVLVFLIAAQNEPITSKTIIHAAKSLVKFFVALFVSFLNRIHMMQSIDNGIVGAENRTRKFFLHIHIHASDFICIFIKVICVEQNRTL